MFLYYTPCNGEPQPGTAHFLRHDTVGLEKLLEDFFPGPGRYPVPVIRDTDYHLLTVAFRSYENLSPIGRILYRITYHVYHYLHHAVFVNLDQCTARDYFIPYRMAVDLSQFRKLFYGPPYNSENSRFRDIEFNLPGFDAGQVEEVRYEAHQPFDAEPCKFEVFPRFFVYSSRVTLQYA